MKVYIPGDASGGYWKISFQYEQNWCGSRVTKCALAYYDVAGKVEFEGYGTAVCNPKDQFVKATGRELALERALDQHINPKYKELFWTAYKNRATAPDLDKHTPKMANSSDRQLNPDLSYKIRLFNSRMDTILERAKSEMRAIEDAIRNYPDLDGLHIAVPSCFWN